MTHLEIENLVSDYLEGTLDDVRKAGVEAHLSGCSACQKLVGDVESAMVLCRSAETMEPNPWLISQIMAATVGKRQLTWWEQVIAFLRPVFQPKVAYGVAMGVFSFSIMVNAAGLDLRRLKLQDLNPRTWVFRVNRGGHLLYARAEKFYYDLRVVYEIESRLRQVRDDQNAEPRPEAPKPAQKPGGSTVQTAEGSQLAMMRIGMESSDAARHGIRTIRREPGRLN
jgi:hypothetical protein